MNGSSLSDRADEQSLRITIYITYFNRSAIIQSESLVPIQAGRAISDIALAMVGDNTGENISEKNLPYSELTSQYWAWKNDQTSDYVGFMHYRRLFNFNERATDSVWVHEARVDDEVLARSGLTDKAIRACVTGYDMLIPRGWSVRNIGAKTVRQQYALYPNHDIAHLDLAEKTLLSLYPDYKEDFDKVVAADNTYFGNMFVFKRNLFEEYSKWLFSILSILEDEIDRKDFNKGKSRVLGYLAEILFGVFVGHKVRTVPQLRVKHLQRVFIDNPKERAICPPLPVTELPIISLVASTDENYAPHLGALISSVLSNADKTAFIDFVILHLGISDQPKLKLTGLEALHPNCKISFVDMSVEFAGLSINTHFSLPTLFRLSLPKILNNRNRVVFLDSDMVLLEDVREIFNIDLQGKLVAAVRELVMHVITRNELPVLKKGFSNKRYLSDYLGMREKYEDYFQAGVMVLDLEKIRDADIVDKMIDDISSKPYFYVDQDVLNSYLVGHVKFLDRRWNCTASFPDFENSLPARYADEVDRSQQRPAVVHYAGDNKPWSNVNCPMGYHYWHYLRMTPWYEFVLTNLAGSIALHHHNARRGSSMLWHISRLVWRILPLFARKGLAPYARWLSRRLA